MQVGMEVWTKHIAPVKTILRKFNKILHNNSMEITLERLRNVADKDGNDLLIYWNYDNAGLILPIITK
jgi:hypothetical protein